MPDLYDESTKYLIMDKYGTTLEVESFLDLCEWYHNWLCSITKPQALVLYSSKEGHEGTDDTAIVTFVMNPNDIMAVREDESLGK